MITKHLPLALLFAAASTAFSATTLQFSASPTGATNFGNASAVAANGMRWGVVISTTNTTFEGSGGGPTNFYDPFNQAVSGFLSVNNVLTDDYYFANGGSITTTTIGFPAYSGVEAGIGAILTANNVPSTGDGVPNVEAGKRFGLIWLSSSTANMGDAYGMFSDPTFQLPASGIVTFSAPFVGADPIRPANLVIAGVPEPSRFLLLGLGGIGLLLRRRRS